MHGLDFRAEYAAHSFLPERGERPWEAIDQTLTEVIGGEDEFCRRSGVGPSEFASLDRDLYSMVEVSIEQLLRGEAAASASR
jgi:hypothetical protein